MAGGAIKGPPRQLNKMQNCSSEHSLTAITSVPFGVTYEKIGTIQRRLAWPLHKDDTLSRSGRPTGLNIYFVFLPYISHFPRLSKSFWRFLSERNARRSPPTVDLGSPCFNVQSFSFAPRPFRFVSTSFEQVTCYSRYPGVSPHLFDAV